VSKGENQECLFEGLIAIFEHIGGVPPKIWFDNTKTIVTKVLKEGERTLTDDFIRFSEHYRFEAVFCNVEAGHEKGNVESKVGYHRRNWLVPVPVLNDWATSIRIYLKSAMRTRKGIITGRNLPSPSFTLPIRLHCWRYRRCRWMSVSTLR